MRNVAQSKAFAALYGGRDAQGIIMDDYEMPRAPQQYDKADVYQRVIDTINPPIKAELAVLPFNHPRFELPVRQPGKSWLNKLKGLFRGN